MNGPRFFVSFLLLYLVFPIPHLFTSIFPFFVARSIRRYGKREKGRFEAAASRCAEKETDRDEAGMGDQPVFVILFIVSNFYFYWEQGVDGGGDFGASETGQW